jgi:cell wall-associated NlpC family hydrolase
VKYAVVTTNIADIWAEPRVESERVNQALFAEPIEVLGSRGGFLKARQFDGYTGWLDSRLAGEIDRASFRDLSSHRSHVVAKPSARLYAADGRTPIAPYVLYYGTSFPARNSQSGPVLNLPGGIRATLKRSAAAPISKNMPRDLTGTRLAREARRFLGTPYLWGGITPLGFDCSGLVRAVCSRLGLQVPRDTKDQIGCGRPVERENIAAGDLLFFDRHVAIALHGTEIVHASRAEGGVRISSLASGTPGYRADLDHSFAAARRIV